MSKGKAGRHPTRRDALRTCSVIGTQLAMMGTGIAASLSTGCTSKSSLGTTHVPDLILGQRGLADGRFQTPRAIAIDAKDEIYVVDKSGRIQRFDATGKFVLGWRTPEIENGKPTGISIDRDGMIMVADTHYYRFLFYTPDGEMLEERTIGGVNGPDPGQFAFVTDIVRAKSGDFYCGEYGEYDRVHRYSQEGVYLDRMGEHGVATWMTKDCFGLPIHAITAFK
jgi:hypothetical protein